jgi:hypothetical protein
VSSPLAIGAVSAVLRNLLDNGLVNAGAPGPVQVTAVAPDTIKLDDSDAPPVPERLPLPHEPEPGWAEVGLPSFDGNGTRISSPPLALDLHYLLTAYGSADFQAEILLGYAMHLLHERPGARPRAIRRALDPSPLGASILPPAFRRSPPPTSPTSSNAVTITREPMDTEEMSRLWSAIQAHYRPTVGYVVSVVLIESRKPARKALPVLERDLIVEPSLLPPYPTITRVEPDDSQPARAPERARAARRAPPRRHRRGRALRAQAARRAERDPDRRERGRERHRRHAPVRGGGRAGLAAGVYLVSVELTRPTEPRPRTSNVAAMLQRRSRSCRRRRCRATRRPGA